MSNACISGMSHVPVPHDAPAERCHHPVSSQSSPRFWPPPRRPGGGTPPLDRSLDSLARLIRENQAHRAAMDAFFRAAPIPRSYGTRPSPSLVGRGFPSNPAFRGRLRHALSDPRHRDAPPRHQGGRKANSCVTAISKS